MKKKNRVLFLDKVLIRGKKGIAVNGAERFNLRLLGSLQEHDIAATVFASQTWQEDIASLSDRGDLELVRLPHIFKIAWPNTLLSDLLLRFRNQSYDALILGNVGRNLLPLVRMQLRKKRFTKILLMAHREPTKLFLRLLNGLQVTVVAVNEQIAEGFRKAGFTDTHVYFGEIRKDVFSPRNQNEENDGILRFCVFGSLDSEWKGSDIAVRAFQALPESIRERSELHLAGFEKKRPEFEDSRIIAYNWIPESEVPAFLKKMDVVLIPSRDTSIMKETFSQATVQAMLTGLPLIVSNLPILKEKVVDGGGLIFTDEAELVEHMKTLFENETLRKSLAIESYEIAKKRYLWDTGHFLDNFLFPTEIRS